MKMMKKVARAAVVSLALIGAATPLAAAQGSDMIAGQVTKVDESAQKVTIKHGPIKQLGMDEGMTMVFRASDAAMLKGLKPGDKIRFAPERVNGQFTVTKIEGAK
jgi:Cu/Ag efflux protein CusF